MASHRWKRGLGTPRRDDEAARSAF